MSQQNTQFPQRFNDNYEITGILGKGGMGYVYKARDTHLNREVAFKVLDFSGESEEAVNRFRVEAQAMKNLHHQNLVLVYDFGQEGDYLYIAMTFVDGMNLSDLLKKRRRLPPTEAVTLAKQLCRGLMYAHKNGIVHRDIKPSNLLITKENRVYITDFGISLVQNSSRLTTTGMAMGTPEYMSPEQCQGEEITYSSDIYGIGIVLYEMLTGAPPFSGDAPLAIAYKHVNETHKPLKSIIPDIHPALDQFIEKALAKKPADRFQNMSEMLDLLDEAEGVVRRRRQSGEQTSIIDGKKDHSTRWFSKAMILPVLVLSLIILLATQALLSQPDTAQGFQKPESIRAAYHKVPLRHEKADLKDSLLYSPLNLVDNQISSAWMIPWEEQSVQLTLYFEKKILITALGIAGGYQKKINHNEGEEFNFYRITHRPRELTLQAADGHKQRLRNLPNSEGTHYMRVKPFATDTLSISIESIYNCGEQAAPLALSELQIIGIPIPDGSENSFLP
jgi:serine/threonine protein kinase